MLKEPAPLIHTISNILTPRRTRRRITRINVIVPGHSLSQVMLIARIGSGLNSTECRGATAFKLIIEGVIRILACNLLRIIKTEVSEQPALGINRIAKLRR